MSWSPKRPLATPIVEVQVRSSKWRVLDDAEETVHAAINVAAALAPAAGEVSVLLADDAALRDLNRAWRGIDKPTNVLSFPAHGDPGTQALLGDIAIAYETLRREADDMHRPPREHLAHLTVHGFLHLLGYDHDTDSQAQLMEELERSALALLDIADPYRAHEPGDA
jgi:probable rRNA maturation factor